MAAGIQPGLQSGLGCGKIDPGHANLGESQFPGPVPYLRNQLVAIELQTIESHPSIVESAVHSVRWPDETATHLFAAGLSQQPALRNAFIALHGDLGAGKTTLVRHLLQSLGVTGRIKSPTYAVVETYQLDGFDASHFDFYRFSDPQEWEDAGFRDIFASKGLKLAEWPEKAHGMLPQPDLDIHLRTSDDGTREVTLTAHSATGLALLQAVPSGGGAA